jgi:hypothetical protein
LAKRICSSHYFNRYFTYTVIEGDISDNLFSELYGQLIEFDFENRVEELMKLLKSIDPEKLLYKMQLNEETITPQGAYMLASNLPLLEKYFAGPEVMLSFMTPFSQAIYLIARLIEKQNGDLRLPLANRVLSRAKTIEFGIAIWRRLHPKIDLEESKWILTESEFRTLMQNYFQSISTSYNLTQLYRDAKEGDLDDVFNIWSDFDQVSLKEFTTNEIAKNRNAFLRLLYAYSETTFSSASPKPYKSGFSRDQYTKLCRVVDIKDFFQYSIKYFGDAGDLSLIDTSVSMHNALSSEQLVKIFQKIHIEATMANN